MLQKILATSLNVLHNYFAGPNKIIVFSGPSIISIIAKFLDNLAKLFFL